MLNKKEKRVLIALDIVELILLLTALIVFTVIFRLVEEPIRYAFLIGDILIICAFSKSLNNIEEMIEKRNEKLEKAKAVPEISL